ncbi:FIST N-terminal domain-containing protein [Sulfurivirga sp.]|uniref:sensor domain-containing diguanylate cyclase n=1 Tax=Sulfurivirga sp. TaxID=2614236 RepID=UPI0025E4E1AC|nr:FIST N-terminal domain-containing protein [Sulfurivirga sp.]
MHAFSLHYRTPEDLDELENKVAATPYRSLLLQVFAGTTDEAVLTPLLEALGERFADACIIGATTGGEILSGSTRQNAIVISALAFERCRVRTHTASGADSEENGRELARTLCWDEKPAALIVLADGIHTNGDALARGIESVAPAVPLAGGLAGDNMAFRRTLVFDRTRFIETGAVAAALYGPLEVHQHANFNWHPIGPLFRITRSQGNRLQEINHIPAIRFYQNVFGVQLIPDKLEQLTMAFPIILQLEDDIQLARVCVAHTEEGDMIMAGNVPEGATFQFGIGSPESIVRESCEESLQLAEKEIEAILTYSCIGRHMLLKEKIEHELTPLQDIAETCGFFTYGELGRINGHNALMNNTTTLLALTEHTVPPRTRTIRCPVPSRREADLMLTAMANFARYISSRLEGENRRATFIAEHDPLTGALNRFAGERILTLLRSSNEAGPVALAMLDLDHFKQINDIHGHQAGDRVLKLLVSFIRRRLRQDDQLIRWGGEEFLIILRGATPEQASARLEQLLAGFHGESERCLGFPVTFSAGVTGCDPALELDTLLKRTDEALYQAKEKGRARVEVAKDTPPEDGLPEQTPQAEE